MIQFVELYTNGMKSPKIKISVERSKDLVGNELTVPEFLNAALQGYQLLKQAAISALGKNVKYDIPLSNLSHSSPACMECTLPSEGRYRDQGNRVLAKFAEQSEYLRSGARQGVPDDFLRRYDDALVKPHNKKISIKFESDEQGIILDNGERTISVVKNMFPQNAEIQTYAVGRLDWLNIHGKKRLKIYPEIEGTKPITVDFGNDFWDNVIKSIGKIVKISGVGRYHPGAFLPHYIKMGKIELIPDGDALPQLSDMYGEFPDITGDKTVEDYLRDLRAKTD